MNVIQMRVQEITPYERNAKKHPEEQVEHIANSIREFGWQQPLVVDKDNVLVIGHGRLMAAKKLGLEQVPVVRADTLTEEQIAALRLADNKTNESAWDVDLLDLELEGIDEIDMPRERVISTVTTTAGPKRRELRERQSTLFALIPKCWKTLEFTRISDLHMTTFLSKRSRFPAFSPKNVYIYSEYI